MMLGSMKQIQETVLLRNGEAHGPALIVHNDQTFTDDDFMNITKLAAATKHDKALKIGKFGIGFCSVYHMTDAPSFISRDRLYIFDPTLSYLKKEVKNPGQPGKKNQVYTQAKFIWLKAVRPIHRSVWIRKNTKLQRYNVQITFPHKWQCA